MSEYNISLRYANALMNLAEEKNILDSVFSDAELIFNTLSKNREIRTLLSSPVIRGEKKLSIMNEIFVNYISKDSKNFIEFVIGKGREEYLFPIYKKFIELRDEKMGFVNVDVTTAIELSEGQIKLITKKLEEFTTKKVRTDIKTDQKIIGGFLIKIKDTVLDASVKHQLELLRKTLIKEKTTVS